MGRPTEFKPEFIRQARELCAQGATDRELAEEFKVSERTLYRWLRNNPDFRQAVMIGGEGSDNRVERSLYNRAVGYSFPAIKIAIDAKTGLSTTFRYVEHVPPDVGAAKMWLTNRRKGAWKERVDHEHSGPDGGAIPIVAVDASQLSEGTLRELLAARRQATDEEPEA